MVWERFEGGTPTPGHASVSGGVDSMVFGHASPHSLRSCLYAPAGPGGLGGGDWKLQVAQQATTWASVGRSPTETSTRHVYMAESTVGTVEQLCAGGSILCG